MGIVLVSRAIYNKVYFVLCGVFLKKNAKKTKKVFKRFGGMEKSPYLCIAFPEGKRGSPLTNEGTFFLPPFGTLFERFSIQTK